MEGDGRALIVMLACHLAGETKETHENLRIASISADIQTDNFPNANLEMSFLLARCVSSTLKMEALLYSAKSVSFYRATRRHISENSRVYKFVTMVY
jgi:hypothetical protein